MQARRAQMFPELSAEEMERLRRYGEVRRFKAGERLVETGKTSPGMIVILSGRLAITHRDGHGHDLLIAEHGRGQFSAELGALGAKPALVDATAAQEIEAILIPPARLRAVLVGEAELGEKITRALILRRVALIETGAGGPVLIGDPHSPNVVRLRNFLTSNSQPHLVFDPAVEEDARIIVAREHTRPEDLPLVVCPDGSLLRNPSESDLARCIGMVDPDAVSDTFDVIVAGAGPAGLSMRDEIRMPASIITTYGGDAVFKSSQGSQAILIIAALLVIYVLLGVL
jgi:thioredoxin reductase (NADPH)